MYPKHSLRMHLWKNKFLPDSSRRHEVVLLSYSSDRVTALMPTLRTVATGLFMHDVQAKEEQPLDSESSTPTTPRSSHPGGIIYPQQLSHFSTCCLRSKRHPDPLTLILFYTTHCLYPFAALAQSYLQQMHNCFPVSTLYSSGKELDFPGRETAGRAVTHLIGRPGVFLGRRTCICARLSR